MRNRALTIAAAALLAASAHAQAQDDFAGSQYKTSGVQIGAYLNGTSATYEQGDETDSGVGLTLRLGYGFGNRLSVFFAATGSSMDSGDYTLAHADFGARYLFADARLRPYVQGAFSGRALRFDFAGETLEARGAAPTVGAGLEYGLGRSAALDVGLNYTFGNYNEGRLSGGSWEDLGEDRIESGSARVDVGVVWRP